MRKKMTKTNVFMYNVCTCIGWYALESERKSEQELLTRSAKKKNIEQKQQ